MSRLRITILLDNYVRRWDLLPEHGWANWVETLPCRIPFDAGQGRALLRNARQLAAPLPYF